METNDIITEDPMFKKLNKGIYIHLMKIPSVMSKDDYCEKVNSLKGSRLPKDINYDSIKDKIYHYQMMI